MVEKPSVMRGESTGWKPGPIGIVCSAIIAIGFLLLVTRLPPSTRPPGSGEEPLASTPRQQVVIFIVDTSDYFDAHGTYVQSVIRQRCPLCEVRQVNLHGDFSIPTLLRALQHVLKISQAFDPTTTTLVNLSLGTYVYDSVFHAMVRSLEAQRVIMIASAGNDNTARPFYPAAFQEVLGICASTRYTKAKTTYSNFGSWVGLCAPGLHYVKRPLRQGALATGTSFASPMVTGVLGQLLIDTPCVSPRVALRALQRTADPAVEHQQYLGAGLLNPGAAASYLRSLYPCQRSAGFFKSLLARVQRLGTGVVTYVGLILYFLSPSLRFPFSSPSVSSAISGVGHSASNTPSTWRTPAPLIIDVSGFLPSKSASNACKKSAEVTKLNSLPCYMRCMYTANPVGGVTVRKPNPYVRAVPTHP